MVKPVNDKNLAFSLFHFDSARSFRPVEEFLHSGYVLVFLILIQAFFYEFNALSLPTRLNFEFQHHQGVFFLLLFGLNSLQKLSSLLFNLSMNQNLRLSIIY